MILQQKNNSKLKRTDFYRTENLKKEKLQQTEKYF